LYLVDMELASQHSPLEAKFLELPYTKGVVDGHLGGGVERDSGEMQANQPGHR
jgi:hypothetical protein